MPIKYKGEPGEILKRLKAVGVNTNYIRQHKLFGEAMLQKLRSGELVSWKTLETLCELLHCQPGDILEYQSPTPDNSATPVNGVTPINGVMQQSKKTDRQDSISEETSISAQAQRKETDEEREALNAFYDAQREREKQEERARKPKPFKRLDNLPPAPTLKIDYAALMAQAVEAEKRRNAEDESM